jgi:hypothetical protein
VRKLFNGVVLACSAVRRGITPARPVAGAARFNAVEAQIEVFASTGGHPRFVICVSPSVNEDWLLDRNRERKKNLKSDSLPFGLARAASLGKQQRHFGESRTAEWY